MLDKFTAWLTYCIAIIMAKLGNFSLQDTATVMGMVLGVVMCVINLTRLLINWHYRRQILQLLKKGQITRGDYDALNR